VEMMIKDFFLVIFLTLSMSLVSCDSWFNSYQNPLSISKIANKKDGKQIYLAGEVIRTIPLLGKGAYQLQDTTGKVWIFTQTKLHVKGTKISIKGKIRYQELPFVQEELYIQEIDTQPYSVTDKKSNQ
jgi:uncharacterized protein YdeI (BOF family)